VLGHHRVQADDTLHPLGHPSLGKDAALLVEHARVVVRLGPIDAHEDHDSLLPRPLSPEEVRGELMDQCSRHDIPPAVRPPRRPVGALSSRRALSLSSHQCSPAGGSGTACPMHAVGPISTPRRVRSPNSRRLACLAGDPHPSRGLVNECALMSLPAESATPSAPSHG
jgi:hypothetical protein